MKGMNVAVDEGVGGRLIKWLSSEKMGQKSCFLITELAFIQSLL